MENQYSRSNQYMNRWSYRISTMSEVSNNSFGAVRSREKTDNADDDRWSNINISPSKSLRPTHRINNTSNEASMSRTDRTCRIVKTTKQNSHQQQQGQTSATLDLIHYWFCLWIETPVEQYFGIQTPRCHHCQGITYNYSKVVHFLGASYLTVFLC